MSDDKDEIPGDNEGQSTSTVKVNNSDYLQPVNDNYLLLARNCSNQNNNDILGKNIRPLSTVINRKLDYK